MGANPMQRMKTNSILIGLSIGLAIGAVMCIALYLFMNSSGYAKVGDKENVVSVCTLTKAIKSGNTITASDVTTKQVSSDAAPKDATMQVIDSIAKIDLSAGTILSSAMITASTETLAADVRQQEYNMITLPTQLSTNSFIDIRLQLPNGGDYIVISKKKVLKCNSATVWLNMSEEEIEIMSNAIIEYYTMPGSKLYATTYVEPGLQTASIGTYVPNSDVVSLIKANPNIKTLISSERYSEALISIRNNYINKELNNYSDTKIENIEQKIKDEIERLKESRQEYFGALNSID